MKVSIIIPAYNAEKYIDETIQSILTQSETDWELIVVNDGSTDSTNEIVSAYLKDSRIMLINQKNAGVSGARNYGMEHASGLYVAFLDADDTWEPRNLEIKTKFLENNPEIDWVFSDTYLAETSMNKNRIPHRGTDENILEDLLLWEKDVIPGPCSNVLVKRKCLESIKFDPSLSSCADLDFTLQLAAKYKGKRIAAHLWTYRVLPTSMSRDVPLTINDQLLVYAKASKNKLFKSYLFKRRCYGNLYMIIAGSYWVNEKNKRLGLYYIFRSLVSYPPGITKLLKKFL